MADFEAIVKKHVNEEGNLPSEAIGNVVTAIKQAVGNEYVEKERYKAKLAELEEAKQQKQTAEDSATTAEKWQSQYEELKKEFDKYKEDEAKKKVQTEKENIVRETLKKIGIDDTERQDAIIAVTKVDEIELEDGKAKEADKLEATLKDKWKVFIPTERLEGAKTPTPPENNGGGKREGRGEAYEIAKKYHEDIYGKAEEDK